MLIKEMFHFIEAIKETISNKTIIYLLYTLIKLFSSFIQLIQHNIKFLLNKIYFINKPILL